MALDLLERLADTPGVVAELTGNWPEPPVTEAQLAVLERHRALPERDLTWVQASLLIDGVIGTPRGRRATAWLGENGVNAENAAKIIELAEQNLRSPSRAGAEDAAPLDAVRSLRRDADAARDEQRRRRLEWARRAPPAAAAPRRHPVPPSTVRRIAR